MKEKINEKNFRPIEFFKNLMKPEKLELSSEEEIDMSELSPEEKKQLTKTLKELSKFENQFNIEPVKHMNINKAVQNISKSKARTEKNATIEHTGERERE